MSESVEGVASGCTPTSAWLRARCQVDRLVALVLGVIALPVGLVLMGLVRHEDGGPALVALPRVGRGGKTFRMWKIRTMRTERRDGGAGGSALTAAIDDRITVTGCKLRRLRLDEIPQLWNVVLGQMALLGPRPEAAEFVDGDDPRWQRVLVVPPGIAGATQLLVHEWEAMASTDSSPEVRYRAEILPVKLAIDEWYVRSASPLVDFAILVDLVTSFIRGKVPRHVAGRVIAEVPAVTGVPTVADRSCRRVRGRG